LIGTEVLHDPQLYPPLYWVLQPGSSRQISRFRDKFFIFYFFSIEGKRGSLLL
jgi:hypothetical protein